MIDAGIYDGDTVVIERCDVAESGAIVVALVDQTEVTLKRLRKKGASIALEPANKNYDTRIFGPDRVDVQGRLVELAGCRTLLKTVGDRHRAGNMVGQFGIERSHLALARFHGTDARQRGKSHGYQGDDQPDTGVETQAIEELGGRTHGGYPAINEEQDRWHRSTDRPRKALKFLPGTGSERPR